MDSLFQTPELCCNTAIFVLPCWLCLSSPLAGLVLQIFIYSEDSVSYVLDRQALEFALVSNQHVGMLSHLTPASQAIAFAF